MSASDDTDGNTVVLGYISGLFGVKGWVKLHSYTEPREALLEYRDCFLLMSGASRAMRIADGKLHGKTVIAKLEAVDDRDAAAELIGSQVAVARSALPALTAGHYYWTDLEGLSVKQRDGTTIGTVSHLLATGGNDVLVVVNEGNEILIPFLFGSAVLDVDVASGVISVDWEWD